MNVDAAHILELRRLAVEVADLVADVRHMQRRQLKADDRRVGAVLLPLAFDLARGQRTTVADLHLRALNARTPTARALCEIMADYGTVKQIGKLFARLVGVALAGHRLVRVGTRGDDVLYVVESVSDD